MKQISIYLALLLLAFVASCTNEEDAKALTSGQAGIKINFTKALAETRATDMGSAEESHVNEVCILVYKRGTSSTSSNLDDYNLLENKIIVPHSQIEQTPYGVYCQFDRLESTGKKLYYVIANPSTEINNLALGSSLSVLMSLRFTYSGEIGGPTVIGNYLMMDGYVLDVENTSFTKDLEVNLKRNLSKIRLQIKRSENMKAQSEIVPDWANAEVKITSLYSNPYQIITPGLVPSYSEANMNLVYPWQAKKGSSYTEGTVFKDFYIPAPPPMIVSGGYSHYYPTIWLKLPVTVNGKRYEQNYYKVDLKTGILSYDDSRNVIYDVDLQLEGLGSENEHSDFNETCTATCSVLAWNGVDYNGEKGVVITSQTGGLECIYNYPATFGVTAVSSRPLTYQWFRNGEKMQNATSSTYTWEASPPVYLKGPFYCVVTDDIGNQAISQEINMVKSMPNCFMLPKKGGIVEFPLSNAFALARSTGSLTAVNVENGDYFLTPLWKSNDASLGVTCKIVDGKCIVNVNNSNSTDENIVVGLVVRGTIVWSWHLWITDYNPGDGIAATGTTLGYKWMARNLGAAGEYTGGMPDSYIADTYGLYYQWGRKDPIVGPKTYNQKEAQLRYVSYEYTGLLFKYDSGDRTIVNSIQNPCTFYKNGEVNIPDDAWGGRTSTKSVFDPCPEGWRVPLIKEQISPWNGGTWNHFSDKIEILKYGNTGLAFPAAGLYYAWNEDGVGNIRESIESGIYWTATMPVYSENEAISMSFDKNSLNEKFNRLKNDICPIRCVKDE